MWNLFLDRFSYSEQHRARQQIVSISCGKKIVYFLYVELGLAFYSPVLRISDPPFFFDCNFQVSCRSLRVWLVGLYTSVLIGEID